MDDIYFECVEYFRCVVNGKIVGRFESGSSNKCYDFDEIFNKYCFESNRFYIILFIKYFWGCVGIDKCMKV